MTPAPLAHQGKPMLKRIVSSAFALALFLGAWKLGRQAIWERQMGAASLSWPTVEGTVIHSGFRTTGSATRASTSVEILYEYQVDGHPYKHDRIQFGAHGGGGGAGQLSHYGQMSAGDSISIYFDPADPAMATLETGQAGRSLGLLAAAGVIAAFGAMLVLFGWSRTNKPEE